MFKRILAREAKTNKMTHAVFVCKTKRVCG